MTTLQLDRTKVPQPGPITAIRFPKYITTSLTNGVPVYLVENHEQPLVSISLYFNGGSSLDTISTQGLASVAAEILNKGTATRTATEIAEAIDFVGGSLGASSSWDATGISTSILSRYLDTAIDLLSDITLNPKFADEELERIRIQRIAGIKQAKSDGGYLADVIFSRNVYGTHPYGFEAGGTESAIAALRTDDLKKYFSNISGCSGAFFIVAGDVTEKEIISKLSSAFADLKQEHNSSFPRYPIPDTRRPKASLIEKPQAVQSALRVGHLGIDRAHNDYVALYVLNMLLGGYFNSRINQNLREKNGFTYGARSYFDARKQTGAFVVSTEVRTEVTAAATREIASEIRRIAELPVTESELSMVKQYIIGSFPLSIETPQQIANRIATLVLFDLEKDYYDNFRDAVARITADDLLRAAKEHLHPDALTIAASGNTNAIKDGMREFGEVEIKNDLS
ncbi:MAG TPA: pitrilysin family protein [Candidatus Kapabacteria bacterium]|nr:pitrilysin family protein [Candidatus Kapabacteria bacterium]